MSLPLPRPPTYTHVTEEEQPRTLWMGDLDPWFSEQTIIHIWAQLGKQVVVKLTRSKAHAHPKYCFVEFSSFTEAYHALSLNGQPYPNGILNILGTPKLLRLNWASAATLTSSVRQSPDHALFIGDLAPATTEAHVLSLFQNKYASVKSVRVMTDPSTGRSRGFGFVRFGEEEERARALTEMDGVWCQGRQMRVAYAPPRSSVEQPEAAAVPGQYNQFTDPRNTTVFVGGLLNHISEVVLVSLFQRFGHIKSINIPPGKGCAFIKYEQRFQAEAAISNMRGFILEGVPMRLNWGKYGHGDEKILNHEPTLEYFSNVETEQETQFAAERMYAAEALYSPQNLDSQEVPFYIEQQLRSIYG